MRRVVKDEEQHKEQCHGGLREKNKNTNKRYNKPWLTPEMKELANEPNLRNSEKQNN